MSWLLDADVLSQPARSHGDPKVIDWLRAEQERCHTSAIVVAQDVRVLGQVTAASLDLGGMSGSY